MAKTANVTSAGPAADIDPVRQYRVKLSRVVPVGRTRLSPRNDNVVSGAVLAELPTDAVVSFEIV